MLTTLGFLAMGTYQWELTDRSGLSQSTLSRTMPAVWDGIVRMTPRYIKFPYNAVDKANIEMQFAAKAWFSTVIRAIDCTHIVIKAPSLDEYATVNHKHFHSINVQIICDPHLKLLNIVVRWPGLTPDSFIPANGIVEKQQQAGLVRDGWLLGE